MSEPLKPNRRCAAWHVDGNGNPVRCPGSHAEAVPTSIDPALAQLVLDTLGMDIRNPGPGEAPDWPMIVAYACRELQKSEAARARFHEGEEPYTDEATVATPAQWIWKWNRATPAERLDKVTRLQRALERGLRCALDFHEERLAEHARPLVGEPIPDPPAAVHADDQGNPVPCPDRSSSSSSSVIRRPTLTMYEVRTVHGDAYRAEGDVVEQGDGWFSLWTPDLILALRLPEGDIRAVRAVGEDELHPDGQDA